MVMAADVWLQALGRSLAQNQSVMSPSELKLSGRRGRPTAGDVEDRNLDGDWAQATAAPAATGAPDVNAATLFAAQNDELVNPRGYDWRSLVSHEDVNRLHQTWHDLRQVHR